jgi:hypothetical protein
MDEQTATRSPLEQLDQEVNDLCERLYRLDTHDQWSGKMIRLRDRAFGRVLAMSDEDRTMRFLVEWKAELERMLDQVLDRRAKVAQRIEQIKAAELERHTSLMAQAHARIDPAAVAAEQAAAAALLGAQQARDVAQRALTLHEASMPTAEGRPAWQRTRRDLIQAIEDAAECVSDAAMEHAAAQRALYAARRCAWAELLTEQTEQIEGRIVAAHAATDAARAAYEAEQDACRDALRDLNAARLLDS